MIELLMTWHIMVVAIRWQYDGDDNAQRPGSGEGGEGEGGEAGGEGAEVEAGDGEGDCALAVDGGAFALGGADAGDGAGEAGEGAGGDEHALAGLDGGRVGVGYGAQVGGEQPYGVLEAAHVGVGDGGIGGSGGGGGAVAPGEVADVAEQGGDGRGACAEKEDVGEHGAAGVHYFTADAPGNLFVGIVYGAEQGCAVGGGGYAVGDDAESFMRPQAHGEPSRCVAVGDFGRRGGRVGEVEGLRKLCGPVTVGCERAEVLFECGGCGQRGEEALPCGLVVECGVGGEVVECGVGRGSAEQHGHSPVGEMVRVGRDVIEGEMPCLQIAGHGGECLAVGPSGGRRCGLKCVLKELPRGFGLQCSGVCVGVG